MSKTNSQQYINAERLLPDGGLLDDIRGTDLAVHIAWYEANEQKRDHKWIFHTPNNRAEFAEVRISTGVGGVNVGDFETALTWMERPTIYDYKLVKRELIPIERTPIPYKMEDTLTVECPECDRVGLSVHPWKLEGYIDRWNPCPCGYDGEFNVR